VLNGDACNVSGMSYLAAFKTPHPPKVQISNFKTKESELTHHFMRVDLVVIEYFITYRRKALIYIDLFNINQASGTDPYGRY
jgi:hypothetical protein